MTSGSVSLTAGVLDGSLGVVGLGLNVLADVIGSAFLVWRFRGELRHTAHGPAREERAAHAVAAALGTVSLVLAATAIAALAAGSHPGHSTIGVITSISSVFVLSALAYRKRRVAAELGSRALRGDGSLSAIGAVVALLALAGLALNAAFDWWWADRVAALIVAALAALEAVRAARE